MESLALTTYLAMYVQLKHKYADNRYLCLVHADNEHMFAAIYF